MSHFKENILIYGLAFVLFWFGYNEIVSPENWVRMVPEFLAMGMAQTLVFVHGIVLVACGLGMIFNIKRRFFAGVTAVLIGGIVLQLLSTGGLNATAVRDIGLLSMALSIYFRS